MASVRQLTTTNREGKRPWVVEYTDRGGKRRRATPPSGLKKDADKLRLKIEREMEDGAHVPAAETVTFGIAAAAWIADCERRRQADDNMAGTTLVRYKNAAKHVSSQFANFLLTKIKHGEMQDYINSRRKNYAAKTLRHDVLALRETLKFAVTKGWLTISVLDHRPLRIPGARKLERAVPSKVEIRAILDVLAIRRPGEHKVCYRNRVMLGVLALFGGLRRGEICGLQWEDVDLERGVLNIRRSLSHYDGLKAPKTIAGIRSVPMTPIVRAALARYRQEAGNPDAGFVLLGERGTPIMPQAVHDIWKSVMRAADLLKEDGRAKYTFHDLRHTNVSMLIQQGLQPIHIKAMIGHSSARVTMDVYGHMFPDDDTAARAVAALSQQFTFDSAPRLERPTKRQERDIALLSAK